MSAETGMITGLNTGLMAAVGVGLGLGVAIVLFAAGISSRAHPMDGAARPGYWLRPPTKRSLTSWFTTRLAIGLVAGVLVLVLTGWPVAAAAISALVIGWPYLFGGARAEQNAIMRLDALIAWTEALRDTVAANASLEQAIAASVQQAPPLIKASLDRLAGRIRVQTPLDEALLGLAEDLDDPSADLVIAALVLNVRRRGDRLAQVLSGLALSAREELDLRRRISAGRAGLRRSVQIVVVITLAIAGYLCLLGGVYLRPYADPVGQVALLGVVALFAAGFIWMRHLAVVLEARPLLSRARQPLDRSETALITSLTGRLPATQRLTDRDGSGSHEGGNGSPS